MGKQLLQSNVDLISWDRVFDGVTRAQNAQNLTVDQGSVIKDLNNTK